MSVLWGEDEADDTGTPASADERPVSERTDVLDDNRGHVMLGTVLLGILAFWLPVMVGGALWLWLR